MRAIYGRYFVRIREISLERAQDIQEVDAFNEGMDRGFLLPTGFELDSGGYCTHHFAATWQRINGRESWEKNEWVWVYKYVLLGAESNDLIMEKLYK
jgi:hypothetical protein